jgi:hypothetical protein
MEGITVTPLRKTPVQARGLAQLENIRDAARNVIAVRGRDGFTTQMIATEAGVSIGTVYSFYKNRVAVLDDLYPDRIEGLTGYSRPTCEARHEGEKCYRVIFHPGKHRSHKWEWED